MSKFRKEVKITKIADIDVLVFICSICGNVMFNANPPDKIKGKKLTKNEFGQ